MALLTESVVRASGSALYKSLKSTSGVYADSAQIHEKVFDVFLSHSSAEPDEILFGIKGLLEADGLSVYIDKIIDPNLSFSDVTKATASILRARMRKSKSLLYVESIYSKKSKWMPWELGYFDGLKDRVGIIPVASNTSDTFDGQEYLNLYPWVDRALANGTTNYHLWINSSNEAYARLTPWVNGREEIQAR